MKFTALIIAVLFCATIYADNIELYKTYEDYKNNTPEKHSGQEIIYYGNYAGKVGFEPVIRIKNEKKEDIKIVTYWGFKYDGILFRRVPKAFNQFYGLLSDGKILFWENATYVFDKLYKTSQGIDINYGTNCALSETLESEILLGIAMRGYFNAHKDYLPVTDCVHEKIKFPISNFQNKHYNLGGQDNIAAFILYGSEGSEWMLNIVRRCIRAFNGNFNPKYTMNDKEK